MKILNALVDWWIEYHKNSRAQFYLTTFLIFWVICYALITALSGVFGWDGIGIAQGSTQTVTTNEIRTWDSSATEWAGDNIARAPNNIIYHAYANQTYALNLSYSDDNGTSWDEITVIENDWESHTALGVHGFQILTNNTTVILFTAAHPSTQYSLNMAFRWNWTGDWEIVQIYKTGYASTYPDLAVNDSDILAFVSLYNTGIRYGIYNPSLRAYVQAWGAWDTYSSTTGLNIVANATGVFWVNWQYWDGSSYRIAWRDLAKSIAMKYATTFTSSPGPRVIGSTVCPNGFYVAGLFAYWSGSPNYYIRMYRMHPVTFAIEYEALQVSGATPAWVYTHGSICVDASNYVTIIGYDTTNDNVYKFRASYIDDDTTWQNSKVEIYNNPGASDEVYGKSGITSLWPQIDNTPVNMPQFGYAASWYWKVELGATDNYACQICLNATWPYISYIELGISNLTMPTGYYSYPYLKDFNVSGGNAPYSWSIVIQSTYGGWLLIDSNGTAYGYCPTQIGTYNVTVTVIDYYSNVATAHADWTVANPPGGASDEENIRLGDFFPDNSCWSGLFLMVLLAFIMVWVLWYLDR